MDLEMLLLFIVCAQPAENVLTLVTCYPFYYVGPAPNRWIVKARQVLR